MNPHCICKTPLHGPEYFSQAAWVWGAQAWWQTPSWTQAWRWLLSATMACQRHNIGSDEEWWEQLLQLAGGYAAHKGAVPFMSRCCCSCRFRKTRSKMQSSLGWRIRALAPRARLAFCRPHSETCFQTSCASMFLTGGCAHVSISSRGPPSPKNGLHQCLKNYNISRSFGLQTSQNMVWPKDRLFHLARVSHTQAMHWFHQGSLSMDRPNVSSLLHGAADPKHPERDPKWLPVADGRFQIKVPPPMHEEQGECPRGTLLIPSSHDPNGNLTYSSLYILHTSKCLGCAAPAHACRCRQT